MRKEDRYYMSRALRYAQEAARRGEVPVGAVIVNSAGLIIAGAGNRVERERSQSAHAEMRAVGQAGKKLGNWRLTGCSIYITLEPCTACLALLIQSRISEVIYAVDSPKYGFSLDKKVTFWLYLLPLRVRKVSAGEEQARSLLTLFFIEQRKGSRVRS